MPGDPPHSHKLTQAEVAKLRTLGRRWLGERVNAAPNTPFTITSLKPNEEACQLDWLENLSNNWEYFAY